MLKIKKKSVNKSKKVLDKTLTGELKKITTGPKTKMLENSLSQFTNTKKTVALNSATAALEMCLRLLGVKRR